MGAKKETKHIYLPLMMGDWLRGTRGMAANVRGVYLGLLIHQYDTGCIPEDIEQLKLIEPEVGSVWVTLKSKFVRVAPGQLQNKKLEDVRDFWSKQAKNGKKGGRPKNNNPNNNPKGNPKTNPKGNLHIDSDFDFDFIDDNDTKGGAGGNYITVNHERCFDPFVVLDVYGAALNARQSEYKLRSWKDMAKEWFRLNVQIDFANEKHVLNSFSKFYLTNGTPKKKVDEFKSMTAEEFFKTPS